MRLVGILVVFVCSLAFSTAQGATIEECEVAAVQRARIEIFKGEVNRATKSMVKAFACSDRNARGDPMALFFASSLVQCAVHWFEEASTVILTDEAAWMDAMVLFDMCLEGKGRFPRLPPFGLN